eukprot:scaffold1474_cov256-Pinguiococcus_pyrenoidosus.AAC.18
MASKEKGGVGGLRALDPRFSRLSPFERRQYMRACHSPEKNHMRAWRAACLLFLRLCFGFRRETTSQSGWRAGKALEMWCNGAKIDSHSFRAVTARYRCTQELGGAKYGATWAA